MTLEHLLFYAFASMLLVASTLVILVRNSVHGVLCLIAAFFASAGIWILLEAEFLALILILVYVGAVMTLFLFVVMMLNLDVSPKQARFVKYFPIAILIMVALASIFIYVVGPEQFGWFVKPAPPAAPSHYSDVSAIGGVLYTQYIYPFELAAVLLLTAIIAAISLSLRKSRAKVQTISKQLQVTKQERLRIVDLKRN